GAFSDGNCRIALVCGQCLAEGKTEHEDAHRLDQLDLVVAGDRLGHAVEGRHAQDSQVAAGITGHDLCHYHFLLASATEEDQRGRAAGLHLEWTFLGWRDDMMIGNDEGFLWSHKHHETRTTGRNFAGHALHDELHLDKYSGALDFLERFEGN